MELVAGTASIENVEDFLGRIEAIERDHDVLIQVFDARYVVNRRHLERAVELAARERARGNAIARDPGVEILLYAAGRRQIERALAMGVSDGPGPVVAVVVDSENTVDDGGATGSGIGDGGAAGSGIGDGGATGSGIGDGDATGSGVDEAARTLTAQLDDAAVVEEGAVQPDDTGVIGDFDETLVREFFDISDRELAATAGTLEDIVLERVTLLVVER